MSPRLASLIGKCTACGPNIMAVLVLKFGGTSVGDVEAVNRVAARVAEFWSDEVGVVVVVSAMGKTTDSLVKMANLVNPDPPPRELDMLLSSGEQVSIALLAMALTKLGRPAVSFTAGQIGLCTSTAHTRARILRADCDEIRRVLRDGRIAVVAGFQGITESGQITTLGRGGSDTTALALAAALHADRCEIFTDVDGVFTADPRKVPGACKRKLISFDEMLELAVLGAGVMHPRAVLFGQRYGIPIHVRNSRHAEQGTLITGASTMMEEEAVAGCALKEDLGRVTLLGLPNADGIQAKIFSALSEHEVFVDDIIQTTAGSDRVNISFTVDHVDLSDVKPAMEAVLRGVGVGEMDIDVGLSKVSVVGLGMRSQTGVAAKMFEALRAANVSISNITTSEIKISCIVNRPDGEMALNAVHQAFELDQLKEAQSIDNLPSLNKNAGERSVLLSDAIRENAGPS